MNNREQIAQQMRRDVPGYTDSVYADLAEIHIEVERQRSEGVDLIRVERSKQ